ncbi:hypothetical protein RQP46_007017 [Phenoliferia psychrophenolica]
MLKQSPTFPIDLPWFSSWLPPIGSTILASRSALLIGRVMTTYDNGLYTPYTPPAPAWTPTGNLGWWVTPTPTGAPVATSPPAVDSASPATTDWAATTTSQSTYTTTPSTTPAIIPSSVSTTSLPPSKSAISSSSTSTISRPPLSSSSSSSTALASSSSQPFKITYLIPVFVILPIVIFLTLLGWTYGRCWGKMRRSGGGNDGDARGGARQSEWSQGILSPEEEGGLVEGKWVGDEAYDEKHQSSGAVSRGSSTWEKLKRMVSRTSQSSDVTWDDGPDPDRFVAVPYTTLDAPFRPPAASANHAGPSRVSGGNESQDDSERGWAWGTQRRPEERPKMSQSESMNQWSLSAKKYRAKSASSKESQRGNARTLGRSDTLVSRIGQRLFGADAPPSPSVYSATEESGPYAGLEDVGEDEDPEAHSQMLDAMLADSRVGSGDLAKRYISGGTIPSDFNILEPHSDHERPIRSASSRPYQNDGFRMSVNLPSAPRPSHTSPTKSASGGVRGSLPQTPPGKSGSVLFQYDSPPNTSTYTALPKPRSAPRRPFPRDAASVPALGALSPPPRSGSVIPIDDLMFSTSPLPNPRNIGAPMPAFEPGVIRASESAFSLHGVQELVYGEEPTPRGGLREKARKGDSPSREEQTSRLRNSAPPVATSVPGWAPVNRLPASPSSHPSRVRAAVEQLETRSAGASPSPTFAPTPTLGSSPSLGTLARNADKKSHRRSETERLPLPPSPTKLSRSTTFLPRDDDSSPVLSDTDKVANLLIQRSKTAAPLASTGRHASQTTWGSARSDAAASRGVADEEEGQHGFE